MAASLPVVLWSVEQNEGGMLLGFFNFKWDVGCGVWAYGIRLLHLGLGVIILVYFDSFLFFRF